MKLNRTAGGIRLYPEIRIRIFSEGNKSSRLTKVRAAPGTGYTAEAIEQVLDDCAEQIEVRQPSDDFELVQVGPAEFNFVWRGYRLRSLT